MKQQLSVLWDLFWSFFKVGAVSFGGGYAMLPIIQREIVSRGFATDEEVVSYYAIGQCTPGVIAVNVATFIGQKRAGVLGGLVATVGVCLPGVVLMLVIVEFISGFADLKVVKDAFAGIRVCVCVLILNAVLKLAKSSLKDAAAWIVFAAVFLLAAFFDVPSVALVVAAAFVGYLVKGRAQK